MRFVSGPFLTLKERFRDAFFSNGDSGLMSDRKSVLVQIDSFKYLIYEHDCIRNVQRNSAALVQGYFVVEKVPTSDGAGLIVCQKIF